jgi:hypothetical protein
MKYATLRELLQSAQTDVYILATQRNRALKDRAHDERRRIWYKLIADFIDMGPPRGPIGINCCVASINHFKRSPPYYLR